ncbi:D-aspartate oxidase-like isoform X2 [Ptychodera flava]|uniref:D-aspartate oxidase-like isoform X2 n=1 Tax=Ptychodera flava TaxID=63121 RepID=UPI00396A431A
MSRDVCVIGAGVVGLASAVNILEHIPDVRVTIIADKFSPNTTADGAAGVWMLYNLGNTPEYLQRRWAETTFHHLETLLKTEESSIAGVTALPMFGISDDPMKEHWSKIVYGYKQVPTGEMVKLFPYAQRKFGTFHITLLCECRMYLPWLMRRFKERGGKLINERILEFQELTGRYDVIVNCTGVDARLLVADNSVQPIRGQLKRVTAPWIKHAVFDFTSQCYIIPCADNIVLGGTTQHGDWNKKPNEDDSEKILQNAHAIYPSLKNATIEHDWVGLRPGRPSVRLETEIRKVGGKEAKIVHNYGHGGSGITLHWGCAQDTTALVAELLGEKVNFRKQPPSKL